MLKIVFATLGAAAIAATALAQTPSITPSQTPSITPSQTPAVTPSQTPPAIVGLSPCENMIGVERDNCLKDERARVGNTGGRAAGAGGTHAPGSAGTGHGSMGAQNMAPSGSTR